MAVFAADGTYCSHQELPATAVQDAPSAELTIPSACSYQHLHTVLLQRPIESKQYTSVEFGGRLKEAGLLPSMGSVADAYDNALAESFVSTLKRELLHRHSWPSREGVRAGIFEYIECFYNPRRSHSSLNHLSPIEYEEVRMRGAAVA